MRTFTNVVNAGSSSDKEKNNGISLTVPDQSLSVREIIARYAAGTLPDISYNENFTEDLPDLRGMDYVQLNDLKHSNRETIDVLSEELKTPAPIIPIDPIDPVA